MNIQANPRVEDVLYTISQEISTRTKPLTDKPDHKQTGRKDNRQAGTTFSTHHNKTECFRVLVSRVGYQNQDPYHTT